MRKWIVFIISFYFLLNSTLYGEEDYNKKAEEYFRQGKFALSEIFYKKVIQTSPDNFQANYNLGKIYYYNDKYDLAIKYLQTAYDIKPSKEIQFLIANSYIEDKKVKQGVTIYSNILKEYPDFADVHLNAGLVSYKYLYDKESTIYHWEQFLKLKPNDEQSPAIRKALEYLRDPNFVLKNPNEKSITSGSNETGITTTGTNGGPLPIIIKGKDLKTESEEKYKLKDKKSITTE